MLTGVRPCASDDVSKTLARVIDRDPDWTALPQELPPVLGTFLRGCLQKNPKQRVHDVADVRLAMEGAFETAASTPSESAVEPTLQVWQRPVVAIAVGLLLVAITGRSCCPSRCRDPKEVPYVRGGSGPALRGAHQVWRCFLQSPVSHTPVRKICLGVKAVLGGECTDGGSYYT